MSARVLECSEAEYFADPCETPSLSQSLGHTLVSKSPAHAWLEHPKLGAQEREETKATDNGKVIHQMLLEDAPLILVVEADNWRTKAAQESRENAREGGLIPVLKKDYDELLLAVQAIRWRLSDLGIELDGDSEVKVAWEAETSDGLLVQCRGMLDHLKLHRGVVYDLKTIRSAHPKVCSRHAVEYGYDIQAAAYTQAVCALDPALSGLVDFTFLFCEIEPPYSVTPARPDGMLRELGQTRWQRAVDVWARCLSENHWPAYAESVIPLTAPAWALQDEQLTALGIL